MEGRSGVRRKSEAGVRIGSRWRVRWGEWGEGKYSRTLYLGECLFVEGKLLTGSVSWSVVRGKWPF